VTTSLQHSS